MQSELKSMGDNQIWNLVEPLDEIQGVDYDEIFSSVAMLKSIRILLSIAAYLDYEVWQNDVKTAFLNENLIGVIGDVYMILPEGFIDPENIGKNVEKPYAYKKVSGSALVNLLVLYDILLIENNISMLEAVKDSLRKSFSMKDLGEIGYILGIRIYKDRSKRLIGLCQSTYIDKVLKRFNMHARVTWHGLKQASMSVDY
ncbi:hypothetical protein U9M48_001733 [Paspalum notatum var. saurae]|uniref:Reverse transcriptase Ty1/copia-type domain-containing protein n=1 Tax=Paspalum notatum var. saurae TaxID=547442 RepID=A0AAQ3PGS9_PASNO